MEKFKIAHRHSFRNYNELKEEKSCGCFYCTDIFLSTEIEHWYEDDYGNKRNNENKTAVCPYCGIDSVIGENDEYSLTKEFLTEMKEYYF